MQRRPTVRALFALLALACAAARSGDAPPVRPPAQDPDAGFLEFLGSVDRLAEVNPDYLAPPQAPRGAASPAPASPPAPPATPVSTPAAAHPAPGPA